ncbi:hypothetical protein CRUP_006897, partial [Coryphaenoides rupestris]
RLRSGPGLCYHPVHHHADPAAGRRRGAGHCRCRGDQREGEGGGGGLPSGPRGHHGACPRRHPHDPACAEDHPGHRRERPQLLRQPGRRSPAAPAVVPTHRLAVGRGELLPAGERPAAQRPGPHAAALPHSHAHQPLLEDH